MKVIILGAGNVGGFIAWNMDLFSQKIDIQGFLDDDDEKIGGEAFGYPVLGNLGAIKGYVNREIGVIIAINNPSIRSQVVEKVKDLNFSTPTLISKNAWISKGVTIGDGSIIYPGCSINYNCVIEKFVIMNMNCALGHDCTIGTCSSLAPGVNLAGFTQIGKGVDVGIGAATKQNVNIGKGAIIGGQSMITKDVNESETVAGVPAKPINKG